MRPINRDSLPHLVSTAFNLARMGLDTAATRLLARWWGIELGPGCRFFGVPLLRRLPGTTIRLGAGCELRSARWSNQVGLDRSCMISTLREGAVVEIGDRTGLSGAVLGAAERIVIGRDVLVGANCTITDTDWHPVELARRLDGTHGASAPVIIEDGAWLSMDVTVLKGVTIGAETVVAAGSVVTRSLPPRVLAGGSPARVLKALG
jgi:carbonic anhydrase/acetyltransferase-like protein (isoleucine patch superfamily)